MEVALAANLGKFHYKKLLADEPISDTESAILSRSPPTMIMIPATEVIVITSKNKKKNMAFPLASFISCYSDFPEAFPSLR